MGIFIDKKVEELMYAPSLLCPVNEHDFWFIKTGYEDKRIEGVLKYGFKWPIASVFSDKSSGHPKGFFKSLSNGYYFVNSSCDRFKDKDIKSFDFGRWGEVSVAVRLLTVHKKKDGTFKGIAFDVVPFRYNLRKK
jgi:hypothetical protein